MAAESNMGSGVCSPSVAGVTVGLCALVASWAEAATEYSRRLPQGCGGERGGRLGGDP